MPPAIETLVNALLLASAAGKPEIGMSDVLAALDGHGPLRKEPPPPEGTELKPFPKLDMSLSAEVEAALASIGDWQSASQTELRRALLVFAANG